MTKVVTTRLDAQMADRLENIAHELNMDKTAFMRIVLIKGLRDIEQESSLKKYERGEISLGKLAEKLGITKWDVLALLKEKGILMLYDEQDLQEDLSAL